MLGEVIQEYLVSLGVQLDKPGFSEFESTLNKATSTVEKSTGSWAKNFLTAQTIVVSALAGITAASLGLIKSAAAQDLEMEKLSRRMMISKDVAWSYKKAIDALGESVSDIQMNPELMDRYQRLIRDGNNMKPGGDYTDTMKQIREMMFEFTRLKQEVSYALNWVGYYLAKYLSGPLGDAYKKLRAFNDMFITNMSSWAEKLARALVYIINVGIHFFDLLKNIGKALANVWESFPRGVKIAIAALGALGAVISMGPVGKLITLIGSLLLLVDDYFGYMEGKEAAFGEYWDKLNVAIDYVKKKYDEVLPVLIDYWNQFEGWLGKVYAKIIDVKNGIVEFFSSIKPMQGVTNLVESLGKAFITLTKWVWNAVKAIGSFLADIASSKEVDSFIRSIIELFDAISDLYSAIIDLVFTSLSALFDGFDETDHAFSFKDALLEVIKVINAMIQTVIWITRLVTKFLKLLTNNQTFVAFFKGLGAAVKSFGSIIDTVVTQAITRIGRLGRALLALIKGDFKGAAALAGSAFGSVGEGTPGKNGVELAQYLVTNGLSSKVAAGAMGSFIKESELDPSAIGDNGTSAGYAQWHNERWDKLKDFAAERGTDWTDSKTQLDYFIWDLKTNYPDVLRDMENASSVAEAADIFTRRYEIPAAATADYDGRMANAESVYQGLQSVTKPRAYSFGKPKEPTSPYDFTTQPIQISQPQSAYDYALVPAGASRMAGNSFAGGGGNTYIIKVGDVNVAQTNASPDEIGNAVADKSMQKLKENGNYILQNRTMGGGNLL